MKSFDDLRLAVIRTRNTLLVGMVAATVVAGGCQQNQGDPPRPAQAAPQPGGAQAPLGAKVDSIRSAFSSTLPASLARTNSLATKACAADKINDSAPAELVNVDHASRLTIVGWALDDTVGAVPAEVFVELVSVAGVSRYYAPAARLTKRPDVAKAHGNPAFENSGYDLVAELAAVPVGTYSVRVVQPGSAGVLTCDTKRRVEVH